MEIEQRRARHFGRLFHSIDLQDAFRHAPFAIQGLGPHPDRHRAVGLLPFVGGQRGGQGRVADRHLAVRRPRFAGAVRDIGGHSEGEPRLAVFVDRQVGLRGELDRERAAHVGHGGAVRDFLRLVRLWRHPPATPNPPVRIADAAHDAPLHFRIIDRRACVGGGLALQGDFASQPRRFDRRVQRHLELRPFVLLHPHDSIAGRASFHHRDPHGAEQPVARGGEASADRTESIRRVNAPFNLLAIHVDQGYGQRLFGVRRVHVLLLVREDRHTLVLNGLSGTVNRAIGEKERANERLLESRLRIRPIALTGYQPAGAYLDINQGVGIHDIVQPEQAVGIRRPGHAHEPWRTSPELPRANRGVGDRLTCPGIQDESFQESRAMEVANDNRQIAHPELGKADEVIRLAELRIRAGDQKVGAGLQVEVRGQFDGPHLEIFGRFQRCGPSQRRCFREQRVPFGQVELRRRVAARHEKLVHVPRHHAEMHL